MNNSEQDRWRERIARALADLKKDDSPRSTRQGATPSARSARETRPEADEEP